VTQPANRSYSIGVIRGDGIGPEVVEEALKVLARVAEETGFSFDLVEYPWSSNRYLQSGELMPESALDEYRGLDALFLGALGDPRVERGVLERAVIMTIRQSLDLYINLRPIALYDERLCPLKDKSAADIDMVVVRENTEDVYVGIGGTLRKGTPDETSIAEMVFTRRGVERCLRYAFELARSRDGRKHVTLVDKSNAIPAQDIWRRTFALVAVEYPDIATDAIYVDAAAMYMISQPERFDVMVTTNLFGDILTDIGAVIQGGMGSAASGNIHPGQVSMFEPIHGSAPDIAGQHIASPIGAISAVAMMLEYLGEAVAARLIESSVRELLTSGELPSLDAKSGLSTTQVGDLVVRKLTREVDALPQA
jgi:3-isopropylmalate dehydrogenase